MFRRPKAIKIGPKLIEFEDHIIRVPNIASVTIGPDPFRRRLSYVLFAAAAGVGWLLLQELTVVRLRHGAVQRYGQTFAGEVSYGSAFTYFLVLLATLAGAIYLFKRKALFISKADSRFTLMVDRNPKFMRDVMVRIREALLAGEASNVFYQVNVQAERIERLDASSNAIEVVNSPGAAVVGRNAVGATIAPQVAAPTGQTGGAPANHQPQRANPSTTVAGLIEQAQRHAASTARSIASSLEDSIRRSGEQLAELQTVQPSGVNHQQVSQSHGAVMIAGGVANSQISTNVRVDAVADLDQLMRLLQTQNIAHHQQLNSYLSAVRDHLAGGPTPRDQALGYWNWFADYAIGTLSGIEGVMQLVTRIGGWLMRA